MADCSKTVEFFKECLRLCELNDGCRSCPFDYVCDGGADGVLPQDKIKDMAERINLIQKWSDEHPAPKPKTYADVFFEKFPNALRDGNDPGICIEFVFGNKPHEISCDDPSSCHRCWNEPYEED